MTSGTSQTNVPDFDVAFQALREGDISLLESLSSQSDFPHGVEGFLEQHWLSHAISSCNLASMKWVLSKEVDVNLKDNEVFSAIKTALQMENDYSRLRPEDPDPATGTAYTIAVLDMLHDAGADINERLAWGQTALHAAAVWSSPTVIQHLLDLGADPTIFDADYTPCRPIDDAKTNKRWEAFAVLEKAMKSRSR